MRWPDSLNSLIDAGILSEVVRPLMSGKEAQIYLVAAGNDLGVAKVYKQSDQRSFKNRAAYTEGRGTRSTRDARAMKKQTRYGQALEEQAWRTAEVDVIYRLQAAGVRVPQPYHFLEGVLVMELITDAHGEPASRLGEVELEPEIARIFFDILLQEVVRMTAAGVVHGDLSEFNILVGEDGPVIIDFPQAVDPARNPNARKLLLRDVENLVNFISRYFPEYRRRRYGDELWDLYARSELKPDTVLTGQWRPQKGAAVDEHALLREVRQAKAEAERDAQRAAGVEPRRTFVPERRESRPRGRAGAPRGGPGGGEDGHTRRPGPGDGQGRRSGSGPGAQRSGGPGGSGHPRRSGSGGGGQARHGPGESPHPRSGTGERGRTDQSGPSKRSGAGGGGPPREGRSRRSGPRGRRRGPRA